MSLLTSLARAYDRLPDAPPFGFSTEKIALLVSVRDDGSATAIDLRSDEKKRPPRMLMVPQTVKRTVGIAPNYLWDKTAYVLGVTAGEGKRTAQEHQAFKDRHAEWLAGSDDPGLLAFLRFLDLWTPDQTLPGMTDDLRDQNAIFTYEPDRLAGLWLHDRPAAREIWRNKAGADAAGAQMCLVNGEMALVARLPGLGLPGSAMWWSLPAKRGRRWLSPWNTSAASPSCTALMRCSFAPKPCA